MPDSVSLTVTGHSSDQAEGVRGHPPWGGGGQELEWSGDPAVSLWPPCPWGSNVVFRVTTALTETLDLTRDTVLSKLVLCEGETGGSHLGLFTCPFLDVIKLRLVSRLATVVSQVAKWAGCWVFLLLLPQFQSDPLLKKLKYGWFTGLISVAKWFSYIYIYNFFPFRFCIIYSDSLQGLGEKQVLLLKENCELLVFMKFLLQI